jgi:hypothetical protein
VLGFRPLSRHQNSIRFHLLTPFPHTFLSSIYRHTSPTSRQYSTLQSCEASHLDRSPSHPTRQISIHSSSLPPTSASRDDQPSTVNTLSYLTMFSDINAYPITRSSNAAPTALPFASIGPLSTKTHNTVSTKSTHLVLEDDLLIGPKTLQIGADRSRQCPRLLVLSAESAPALSQALSFAIAETTLTPHPLTCCALSCRTVISSAHSFCAPGGMLPSPMIQFVHRTLNLIVEALECLRFSINNPAPTSKLLARTFSLQRNISPSPSCS